MCAPGVCTVQLAGAAMTKYTCVCASLLRALLVMPGLGWARLECAVPRDKPPFVRPLCARGGAGLCAGGWGTASGCCIGAWVFELNYIYVIIPVCETIQ